MGRSSGPGLEVVADKRNSIVVHAGRSNNKENADVFYSGLGAANLLGIYQGEVSKPEALNFAFAGTLTLTFGGRTHTFPDFRLGQGQTWRHWLKRNNWWIGSAACSNWNGEWVAVYIAGGCPHSVPRQRRQRLQGGIRVELGRKALGVRWAVCAEFDTGSEQ